MDNDRISPGYMFDMETNVREKIGRTSFGNLFQRVLFVGHGIFLQKDLAKGAFAQDLDASQTFHVHGIALLENQQLCLTS